MQFLKSALILTIIVISIFTTNSYKFNKIISSKNTFMSNKKRDKCIFNSYKVLPNNKNFTSIPESEEEDVNLFIQEGEIDLMD